MIFIPPCTRALLVLLFYGPVLLSVLVLVYAGLSRIVCTIVDPTFEGSEQAIDTLQPTHCVQ